MNTKRRQHATSGEKVAAAWVAWKAERKAAKLAAKQAARKKRPKKKRRKQKAIPASRYYAYIASEAWKKKRAWAIKEHGGRCAVCGTSNRLQVHHKHYRTLGHEGKEDLEVLCFGCHSHEHEGQVFGAADTMTREFLSLNL